MSRARAPNAIALCIVAACACSSPVADSPSELAQPSSAEFVPPGVALPSGEACAARVQRIAEYKSMNDRYNSVRGRPGKFNDPHLRRVDGDFVGTTDEILQWGACKWGLPVDVVRAQAIVESYWKMTELGDWTVDHARCAPPANTDPRGMCAESVGILQVRYAYHAPAFPEAATSTAFNVDYAYGVWRKCFEGHETWLRERPPGSGYRAGDAWGCFGRWGAGEWYSEAAKEYAVKVHRALRERKWLRDPSFRYY